MVARFHLTAEIYSELSNDERRELRTKSTWYFREVPRCMTVEENVGFPLKMFTNKSAKLKRC